MTWDRSGRRNPLLGTSCCALALKVLLFSIGCSSKGPDTRNGGISLSADLAMTAYAELSSRRGVKGTGFFFPQLEIYDESGNLVYSGHESLENAELLKKLPESIKGLRPLASADYLVKTLDSVQTFRVREQDVLGRRQICVVSVVLEDCHACAVQEAALNEVENRLIERGANVLVIRVLRP